MKTVRLVLTIIWQQYTSQIQDIITDGAVHVRSTEDQYTQSTNPAYMEEMPKRKLIVFLRESATNLFCVGIVCPIAFAITRRIQMLANT